MGSKKLAGEMDRQKMSVLPSGVRLASLVDWRMHMCEKPRT
jgi:hypothetical protein